jgi:hypothetical protein
MAMSAKAGAGIGVGPAVGVGIGAIGNAKAEFATRDAAVRKLQRAFRAKQARNAIKKMVRENYVKVFDKFSNKYMYKNRHTKEITAIKPRFLGNEDLPNPRSFNAPVDYDPNDDYPMDGYAFMVTVNKFPAGKMADLPEATDSDHILLEKILTHDYICKFRPENVIVLKQPSCSEFMDGMNRLRRICKRKGYFVMYLCTHVVTVFNGDKNNSKETGYICMKDTLWTKPHMIANTSISLGTLVACLNKLDCKFKTVFLNYAHSPVNANKSTVFSSKILYPPPNFATRLANEANAAVVANCATGASLRDLVNHTAASTLLPRVYENKQALREELGWKKNYFTNQELKEFRRAEEEAAAAGEAGSRPNSRGGIRRLGLLGKLSSFHKSSKSVGSSGKGAVTGGAAPVFPIEGAPAAPPADPMQLHVNMETIVPQSYDHSHEADQFEAVGTTPDVKFDEMFDQFVRDWKVELESEDVYVTPKPTLPEANWYRDENDDDKIRAEMPTQQQVLYMFFRCLSDTWKVGLILNTL